MRNAPRRIHPPRGRLSCRSLQHGAELVLIDDADAELLGLRELAAGVFAGQDDARLFAHAAGGAPAARFDEGGGLVARERGQRAREDKGHAAEALVRHRLRAREADARLAQEAYLVLRLLEREPLADEERRHRADVRDGLVAVNGWLEKTSVTADDLLAGFVPDGLQSVIVTDISRDGMLSGPAIPLYRELMEKFPGIQVIASGGVGSMSDIEALDDAGVPAVIVGKAIYEGKIKLC